MCLYGFLCHFKILFSGVVLMIDVIIHVLVIFVMILTLYVLCRVLIFIFFNG